jgi:hypothetical protein
MIHFMIRLLIDVNLYEFIKYISFTYKYIQSELVAAWRRLLW